MESAIFKQIIDTLEAENKELKSIKESLEVAFAEQERIIGKLIDEILDFNERLN